MVKQFLIYNEIERGHEITQPDFTFALHDEDSGTLLQFFLNFAGDVRLYMSSYAIDDKDMDTNNSEEGFLSLVGVYMYTRLNYYKTSLTFHV